MQYFRPEGGDEALDPSFAPVSQAAFREDDAILQAQAEQQRAQLRQGREWEAQDAAYDFSKTAPGSSYEKMLQTISPEVLSDPKNAAYVGFRQREQRPSRLSTQVLGPQLALKIKDPRHVQEYNALLEGGADPHTAFEQVRLLEFKDNQAKELAAAGVPEETWGTLQGQDGMYDPVKVARAVESVKSDPRRERAVTSEMLGKYLELKQMDPELAKEYAQTARDNGYLWAGLEKTKPAVVPAVVEPKVAPVPEAQSLVPAVTFKPLSERIPKGVTPEQFIAQKGAMDKAAQEEQEAAKAWTSAKSKLINPFLKAYPSPDLQLIAARAILDELPSEDPDTPSYVDDNVGVVGQVPYGVLVAKKLGLDPNGAAFDEPGNLRFGTQTVTNNELLKAFAEDVIKAHSEQEKAAAPPAAAKVLSDKTIEDLVNKYPPKK